MTFSPQGGGDRTATLTIASNAFGMTSYQLGLAGTGMAAAISVSGNAQFGQAVLSQDSPQTFTISNSGNGAACLERKPSGAGHRPNAGDFQVSQPSVATVAPGGTATFSIDFCPQGVGSRTATLTIASNAPATSYQLCFREPGWRCRPCSTSARCRPPRERPRPRNTRGPTSTTPCTCPRIGSRASSTRSSWSSHQ